MHNKSIEAKAKIQKTKANVLREQGYVPGVIYGQTITPIPIIFEIKAINRLLREDGENAFFEIMMDNNIWPVRLKEVQRDPLTRKVIHIDALALKSGQKIRAEVPIRIEGGGKVNRDGIIIQRQKNTVCVEGLADNIPDCINVSVERLGDRRSIRVGDLEISEEISIIDNYDAVVLCTAKHSRLDIEEILAEGKEDEIEDDIDIGEI
ncbi:MAG: 50S ribosomal protein L25 [Clostridiales bacterium]|nr:50S ribosomal protein L25 [Clostridiales bacterium]